MSHQDPIVFCNIINLKHHQVLVKLDTDEDTGNYHVHIITWLDFGEVATVLKLTTTELSDAQHYLDWFGEYQIQQHVNTLSEMMGLEKPYEVAA